MQHSQEIAERIKTLCNLNKITVNQLLLKCNINTSFITDLGKGRMPSVDKILKIANRFNVSTDYLLGLTDTSAVTPPLGETINLEEENEKMDEKKSANDKEIEDFITSKRLEDEQEKKRLTRLLKPILDEKYATKEDVNELKAGMKQILELLNKQSAAQDSAKDNKPTGTE